MIAIARLKCLTRGWRCTTEKTEIGKGLKNAPRILSVLLNGTIIPFCEIGIVGYELSKMAIMNDRERILQF